jgi:hypothetical protein
MDEAMSTLATNTAQRQAAIQQQLARVDLTTKDADTAFLLELVGGVLGFLGIGYLYSGLTNAGLARLVGLWAGWFIFGILGTVTFGLGLCFAPLFWIGAAALSYFSANDLKQSIIAAKAASPAANYSAGTPTGYIGAGTTTPPAPPMTPTTPTEAPVERNPDDTF